MEAEDRSEQAHERRIQHMIIGGRLPMRGSQGGHPEQVRIRFIDSYGLERGACDHPQNRERSGPQQQSGAPSE